jgi:excisionase family DNA binding protein
MLTVKQVSERYGVEARTVLAWIRAGDLAAIDVTRRTGSRKARWRITQAALDAFEAARAARAPTPKRAPRRQAPDDVIPFYA